MRIIKEFFWGRYYKHQKNGFCFSVIVGKTKSENFIQIITNNHSYVVPNNSINRFNEEGIFLNIQSESLKLQSEIKYDSFKKIKYDIMGPFKYFKMECRHEIVSMYHKIDGYVIINGQLFDLSNGVGYIEGDSGRSFPEKYCWIQANDFNDKTSIMLSIAKIPFFIFHFTGCISVIMWNDQEYRLATYLGAKIVKVSKNQIILKQRKYRLVVDIDVYDGKKLQAPQLGKMTRVIKETIACKAKYSFYIKNKLVFSKYSNKSSVEYEM